jgi:GNAT superfamily N-acetyltransferase
MTDLPERRPYTVCAAFIDADCRATVVVQATSYEDACGQAIALVDDGVVSTSLTRWDPRPTFVLGVVEGEDADPFAGSANVPDRFHEDALEIAAHNTSADLSAVLAAARALIDAGQPKLPSPIQARAFTALSRALDRIGRAPPASSPSSTPTEAAAGNPETLPAIPNSAAAFLVGPGRPDVTITVDPVFAKGFSEIVADAEDDDPESLVVDEDADPSVAEADADYSFATCAAGVLLLAGGTPVGGYLNGDLAIEPLHRRRGLGAELVLEFFLRWGRLPTWNQDKPGFSPLGERAHLRAYELAQDPARIARKRAKIFGGR